MPESRKREVDRKISQNVLQSAQFQRAQTVFVYFSTNEEIDTHEIIQTGLAQGKRICLPKCLCGHRMEARRILSCSDLTEQSFGIPEPHDGCTVITPDQIDLCIVPALACDHRGFRLGYGGGFYDRFLPCVAGNTIALCASDRFFPTLPTDKYDVRCCCIITENEVYIP